MRVTSNKKIILSILLLTLIVLVGALYFKGNSNLAGNTFMENTAINLNENISQPSSENLESDSPTPFEEITIPYLSTREYNSSLGTLQKVSETTKYTSYLTSYTSDGLKINALLTEPKGDMPDGGWPAIVFIHGYIPPKQYQTQSNYISYVDYLASNGFAVFKIDLRGHGTSEGEAGGGYYGSDYIIDTIHANEALKKSNFINPSRIGLWGHSMAGNIILRSVAAKKDIPAVVIWAGAVYTYQDFRDYRIQDGSYQAPSKETPTQQRRNQLFETHGQFDANSEFWKKVVPTNYLDGIKTAIQLNHSVDDNVVRVNYSRNLMSVLDKTNIKHEIKEYPTGGHNISGSAYNQAMQNTVNFFKENL